MWLWFDRQKESVKIPGTASVVIIGDTSGSAPSPIIFGSYDLGG